MSAKYKSPSFLLPNELNTSANPANDTGINSLYSMDFDGSTNTYINIPNFPFSLMGTGISSTLSIWIKIDSSTTQNAIIFSQANGTSNRYSIYFDYAATKVYFSPGTLVPPQPNGFSINFNQWYHFVCVLDGTNAKFYANGNQVGSTTSYTPKNTNANMAIGRDSAYNTFNHKGQIDEVAIFNRALTDGTGGTVNEIAALYEGTSPNIYPSNLMATNLNPIAYYPLGEQAQNSGYLSASGNEWQFPNGVLQDYVMDFDGGDNVNITDAPSPNGTQTLSMWINTSTSGNNGGLFTIVPNGATSDYWSVALWNSNIHCSTANTGSSKQSTTNVADGDWHNIIFVKSSSVCTHMYIDGDLQTLSNGSWSGSINTPQAKIGSGNYSNTEYYFTGKISNVVLWTSDQSANKDNIYNNGSPQTSYTVTPQNWWKLNADSVYTPSAPNYTTALDFNNFPTAQGVIYSPTTLPSTSAWSVSFWAVREVSNQNKWFWSAGSISNGAGINNESSQLVFTGTAAGDISMGTTPFAVGDLFHMVASYDGSTLKVYIDGSEFYSGSVTTNISTDYIIIGGWNRFGYPTGAINYGYSQNDIMSNFAVWDSALSASQVSTLFNFGTPETNISFSPRNYYKLDNTTTGLNDLGSGGANASISGTGITQVNKSVVVTPSWKIPDASGTVNGVSTTLPSTALQQSDLQFDSPYSNYSLYFDGASSRVQALYNLPSGVTKFSVSIWGNVEGAGSSVNKCLISNESGNAADGYTLFTEGTYPNTKVWFKIENNTSTQTTSNIVFGEWFHVLGTYDNGIAKIYFNGVLEDTTTGIPAINTSTLVSTMIGSYRESSPIIPMLGHLDEAAIWDTVALTDAQVLEIYNNGKPGDISTLSPTNWWRLGENAYFNNGNKIVTPNSIIGGVNGIGSGTVNDSLSANAPGTYANGIGTDLDIIDRVGDAALSTSNSQSYNMIPSDISPYVPQYVGNQIANNFSMAFDGTNYFTASSKFDFIQQTGIFSISTWIKMSDNTSATNQVIAGTNYTAPSVGWQLWIDNRSSQSPAVNKTLKFHLWNSATNLLAIDQVITDNNWNLITITGDGTTIRAYKNASLLSTTQSISGSTSSTAFSDLRIGANTVSSPSVFFNGQIDEVAIFDTALNAGQIYNDIYQPTSTATNQTADLVNNPNLPNPVAWYRMGD